MKLGTKFRSVFGRAILAAAVLGGFLLFAGTPNANANDRDDCNRRIAYTESRYHEAVEQFGPYSRNAQYWNFERREARARAEHFRREWREYHRDHDDRYRTDWDRR